MNIKNAVVRLFDFMIPPLPWSFANKKGNKKLLMISGIARSGNHLVRGLLDGISELAVPPDEDYFIRTLVRHRVYQLQGLFCGKDKSSAFYKKMQKRGNFERINKGEGINSFNAGPMFNLDAYYAHIYSAYMPRSLDVLYETHFTALKKAIGQKEESMSVLFSVVDPLQNDVLNIGRALCPYYAFKTIFIFRDPRDIYCSAKKRNYFKSIKRFVRSYNKYRKDVNEFERNYPGYVFRLSYEDLVRNPEKMMKKVASFIGVQFTKSMIEYTQYGVPIQSNSSFAYESGINSSGIGRFKEHLNDNEIEYINTRCVENN